MNNRPLISICIPAYNRPIELAAMLYSIAAQGEGPWDVVICEDHSPKADEIESVVSDFSESYPWLCVSFYRNSQNLGYDANIRQLIERANGEFTMFVGDDDALLPNSLRLMLEASKQPGVGVILRAWRSADKFSGETIEEFRYFPDDRLFQASPKSAAALFRRSIFISGLTVKRDLAHALATADLDGTLLYRLYLVARLASSHNSYYVSVPTVTRSVGGEHFFGNAAVEKNRFSPSELTVQHSLNFIIGIFQVAKYSAEKIPSGEEFFTLVKQDFARYSYPLLDIQARRIKRMAFAQYAGELGRIGLKRSGYFWLYAIALLLLGPRVCSLTVRYLKLVLGRTPNLGGSEGVSVSSKS